MHIPELKNPEVTLRIGTDVHEAHWRLEERRGRKKEPYAVRTPLGWSVAGPMGTTSGDEVTSFFARGENDFIGQTVEKMFEMDFSEKTYGQSLSMSLEDKKALSIMEESLKVIDGHYQLDLPFRDKPALPNNRILAERRLHSLAVRFRKDPDLYEKYKDQESQFPAQIFAAKQREVSTH